MAVRIVRLGTSRHPDEGLRIGTVRRPPRGVQKADYCLPCQLVAARAARWLQQ